MMKSFISSALALGICFASTAAHAQFSQNSNAPITGSADNVDYQQNLTILSGQVDVRQEETRILADVMKIYSADDGTAPEEQLGTDGFNNIERIEAQGNFYYLAPGQEVRGEKGVYEAATETFTVTGNVILLQGEDNIVTGEKLIYNTTTNQARVVGTCTGRRCGKTGRVNILLKNTNETQS